MPLLRDLRTANRVLREMLQSRQMRRQVAREQSKHKRPQPGKIKIAVYFADAQVNLYQLRQWYAPLAEIAGDWPVAIIARSPSSVLALWKESPVPVLYLRQVAELERFVYEQDIRIVFYVNQDSRNFQMFRYGRMWHVFINHGESDKMYMTTNQFKAYDYSLVAGDAAMDRLSRRLWDYDLSRRAIAIGRPQADHVVGDVPYLPDERTVVLYAPTWEGDRAAAAYGSIASHGVALVTALLATDKYRLIYRPHPRSGVVDREYGEANRTIIAAIATANASDPSAHHVYDVSGQLGWQLNAADIAVTDISAMVYDRLATGKPLIVTRPISSIADVNEGGYLGACEWLTAAAAGDIRTVIERVQSDEGASERLAFWARHYFGDLTPGEATRRFRSAISHLFSEWEKHNVLHEGDREASDDDPLGDEDGEEMFLRD